jgi:hypothetical protein
MAFRYSWGLGVGPGSFRSSSVITAIIGSVGVVGTVAFFAYVIQVFKPFAKSTYFEIRSATEGIGVAAGWAAIIGLIPAAVQAPSSDPGLSFAVLCGLSLALRGPIAVARAERQSVMLPQPS